CSALAFAFCRICRSNGCYELMQFPNPAFHLGCFPVSSIDTAELYCASIHYRSRHGPGDWRVPVTWPRRQPMSRDHPTSGKCPVTHLTTAFGAPVPENQNSLTAGPRGPLLAQDVWLQEKLANFVREVIPERRMHAKGSGAFGAFTVTNRSEERRVGQDYGPG